MNFRAPARLRYQDPPERRPEPRPTAPPRERVLELQRSAGNAAVTRMLARAPGAADAAPVAATDEDRVSYVFLMGDPRRDGFYRHARRFFAQDVPQAKMIMGKKTLADIIETVNAEGKKVATLFIVSHANQAGNLSFSMNAADLGRDRRAGDRKPRTEFDELAKANEEDLLPQADTSLIDATTDIQIKGCNIGRSELMLDELEEAFGGEAAVTAPTHKQEYRSEGSEHEEFLHTYFLEEPGRSPKKLAEVRAEFKQKYADVPEKRWKSLLKKVKRKDEKQRWGGWKGPNPPADDEQAVFNAFGLAKKHPGWTLTYEGRTEEDGRFVYTVHGTKPDGESMTFTSPAYPIPRTDEELLEEGRASHGRPDAYEWTVESRIVKGMLDKKVWIRRTEWTIKATIEDESGRAHPDEDDPTFYGKSDD